MSAPTIIQLPGTVRRSQKAPRPAPATLEAHLTALIDELGATLGCLRPSDQEYISTILRLVADRVREKGFCDWNYSLKL